MHCICNSWFIFLQVRCHLTSQLWQNRMKFISLSA